MGENRRPRDRRFQLLLALVFGTFFLLGLLARTQLPELERFARVQIDRYSDRNLPARVRVGKLELTAFPFGARVRDVRVTPKGELSDALDPFTVREASFTVDVSRLFRGQFRADSFEAKGASLSIRLPKPKNSSGPPLEGAFEALESAPIERIRLQEIELRLESKERGLKAELARADLALEKTGAGLAFELGARSLRMVDADGAKSFESSVDAKGALDRRAAVLSGASLRMGDSYLVANGEAKGDLEALEFDSFEGESRASLELAPLLAWARKTFPGRASKIPDLAGQATIEAAAKRKSAQAEPEGRFQVKTEGFVLDRKFKLGRLDAAGSFKGGAIAVPKATLETVGGRLETFDGKATIAEGKAAFSTRARAPSADLHVLLQQFGVPEIPVWLKASGDFPSCEGEIAPAFKIVCRGKVVATDAVVKGELKAKGRIVAFKSLEADGEATFDLDQTTFKAELKTPGGRGRSSGSIAYEKGFDIAYEADALPFADLESLGDLKIEGTAALKGKTSGDSNSATFSMQADGKDLWLEDWWLGDAQTRVSYKSGRLSFEGTTGHYATSRYSADVAVDFRTNSLEVDATAPFIDARDLVAATGRKFKLPAEITGTGQAQAKVSGPFQLNALSYDLKSTLYRGTIAREPFDQARFDVRARKGEVEAQRVEIVRGPASIRLEGRGRPSGEIDAAIRGRGVRLESLSAVSALGAQVGGLLEFDMNLSGDVLAPLAELRGSLVRASVGEQAVPDSSFRLRFGRRTIAGGATLLGDAVKADFVWPLTSEAPFAINVAAQDWNFAPALSALSGSGPRKEYEARVTGALRLSSPSGGFWNATGSLEAEKFLIKRASLQVAAPRPILASMQNGRVRIESFALEGDRSSLRATDSPNPAAKFDAQFVGKLDLSIVALLAPFFEDLRGSLSFAFNAKAGPDGGGLLGSAYVERGYLKLFDFPHPFEEIKADALFNERRVLLNSLRSDFAGGRLTADGSVEFKGYKNVPVNVNAQIERVALNVPDKVMTKGSGRLSVTGNWFPFLMKGQYDVREGLVSMEFESGGSVEGVRRSAFLPSAILQESASPIQMDLTVSMPRPIELKNKLIEGRATGEIRVLGPPGKPSILGKVSTEKDTRVTFRESVIFEVLNGAATFDDPNEINPRLYVNARTRLTTPQQDYDINLVVQGRARDPKVSLSSQPPRLEKDIISLLALGTETSAIDATASAAPVRSGLSSNTQVAGTGATVGTQLLSRPINEEIKKKTGFNVSFTSSFDDANNGAVPKVIASRQFTPKFSVTASRSFGTEPRTDARVRYRLSPTFSVLGTWEGQDRSETGSQAFRQQQDPSTLNKVGLDLEYKFEFK